ncbi:MAG: hypothetical protein JXB50_05760 [Spirochaetes bacterium]|nr:hypothetical protein [Spirochaetota bacterium]
MIISKKIDKFDKKMKILLFDTDKNGNLVSKEDMPEFAGREDLANVLYYTKSVERQRLMEEVIKGEISPIKMFIELQTMDINDVASRMRLPVSKVKKHLTFEGFKQITIEELQKYSIIFDVSVADFFQFLILDEKVECQIKNFNERIIQKINVLTLK